MVVDLERAWTRGLAFPKNIHKYNMYLHQLLTSLFYLKFICCTRFGASTHHHQDDYTLNFYGLLFIASRYMHLAVDLIKFSKTPVLIHCFSLKALNINSIKDYCFTITVPFSVFLRFSMSTTLAQYELRWNLIHSMLFSLSSVLCLLWRCSSLVAISFCYGHLMRIHHVILLCTVFLVAICPVSSVVLFRYVMSTVGQGTHWKMTQGESNIKKYRNTLRGFVN
jgi:hypothetical protein